MIVPFWLALLAVVMCQQPSYDHQTTTYYANHEPYFSAYQEDLTLTSFFSPDHSLDTTVAIATAATTTLDIGTPSWYSWSNCTNFNGGGGCNFTYLRNNEAFPLFAATLDAILRGVKVRILTNNFETFPDPGYVYPLDFLAVAGADVRYYTTTTFYHSKYMQSDGKRATISSINYSYTSYMKNREAGLLLEGDSSDVFDYLTAMFEVDWNQATEWPTQSYNASDVAIARNPAPVPVPNPKPPYVPNVYHSHTTPVNGPFTNFSVFVSPDYAWDTLTEALNNTQKEVKVYIYQITGGGFCEIFQNLYKKGVTVTLLVSAHIFDPTDYASATKCYTSMYYAGLNIRKAAAKGFTYEHNKFALIDGELLLLSTGNFGPTDYPQGSQSYVPYGSSAWRKTNRDHTVSVVSKDLVDAFDEVFTNDYETGYDWSPKDQRWVRPSRATRNSEVELS